jgi:hypothetical protein
MFIYSPFLVLRGGERSNFCSSFTLYALLMETVQLYRLMRMSVVRAELIF